MRNQAKLCPCFRRHRPVPVQRLPRPRRRPHALLLQAARVQAGLRHRVWGTAPFACLFSTDSGHVWPTRLSPSNGCSTGLCCFSLKIVSTKADSLIPRKIHEPLEHWSKASSAIISEWLRMKTAFSCHNEVSEGAHKTRKEIIIIVLCCLVQSTALYLN